MNLAKRLLTFGRPPTENLLLAPTTLDTGMCTVHSSEATEGANYER